MSRVEFGDWQTPLDLARAVVELVAGRFDPPSSIVEPTCGDGAFLIAAAAAFPSATLLGFDISESHVANARACLPASPTATRAVEIGNFFTIPWAHVLDALPDPLLILGNPPWVTNAALGGLGATNLPTKANFKRAVGLDARTGASNFDISESMLICLIEAAMHRRFTIAMLCKASVARRIMQHGAARGWPIAGDIHTIDARIHFSAAVDAVLLQLWPADAGPVRWPIYPSLQASVPTTAMGVIAGTTYSDLDAYAASRALEGPSEIEWRSGIKHDCSSVMELQVGPQGLTNGLGESVELEAEHVFPLLKGSDLANGRLVPRRRVIVTQRSLRADTRRLREQAPNLWKYLEDHQEWLAARKSSIYRGQPPYAIFGVGEYSFAPFKVAICGLYKRLAFTVLAPFEGQPVMVDDTAYFLPCSTQAEAERLAEALNGTLAHEFFQARVFWAAKRPITKALLQSLSLDALLRAAD